jgi:beta-galactosidase
VSYGAEGFYPVDPLHASVDVLLTKGDLPTPTWYNEFVTGGPGNYGTEGTIRMWAYIGLIDYGQTYFAWTFNTHRGGEEQALFGLLDHDGTPSWKYREFAQIASECAKLEHLGFPHYYKPDVAIAYSFDSLIASHPTGSTTSVRRYFTTGYREQVDSSLQPFFEDNIDAALINIAHAKLDYKLLVVPADFVMDAASADAIRSYVGNGGTVVMAAFSAKVDEHGQWFNTALPGRLSDVFGIRTEEFYRPTTAPEFSFDGVTVKTNINFYEVLEPRGAQPLASFTNTPEKSPAITINTYGKSRAIYVSVSAQMPTLAPLMRSLYPKLDIARGPKTPTGVYARVVEGRTLYVNTTGVEKTIAIRGKKREVLSGHTYDFVLRLRGHDTDRLE